MLASLIFVAYTTPIPPGIAELSVPHGAYPNRLIGTSDRRLLPDADCLIESGPTRTIAEWKSNTLTLIKRKALSGYQVLHLKLPPIDNLYGWSDTGFPILNTKAGLYLGDKHLKIPFPKGAELETIAMLQGQLYWLENEPKKDPQRLRLRSSAGLVGPYITGDLAGIMVTKGGFLLHYSPTPDSGVADWLDFLDLNGHPHPISHQAKTDYGFAPDREAGAWIVSFGHHRKPTSKYSYRTDVYRIAGNQAHKVGSRKGEFMAYDLEPDCMYGTIFWGFEMGAWRLSQLSYSGKEIKTIATAASPYYPLPQ